MLFILPFVTGGNNWKFWSKRWQKYPFCSNPKVWRTFHPVLHANQNLWLRCQDLFACYLLESIPSQKECSQNPQMCVLGCGLLRQSCGFWSQAPRICAFPPDLWKTVHLRNHLSSFIAMDMWICCPIPLHKDTF